MYRCFGGNGIFDGFSFSFIYIFFNCMFFVFFFVIAASFSSAGV